LSASVFHQNLFFAHPAVLFDIQFIQFCQYSVLSTVLYCTLKPEHPGFTKFKDSAISE